MARLFREKGSPADSRRANNGGGPFRVPSDDLPGELGCAFSPVELWKTAYEIFVAVWREAPHLHLAGREGRRRRWDAGQVVFAVAVVSIVHLVVHLEVAHLHHRQQDEEGPEAKVEEERWDGEQPIEVAEEADRRGAGEGPDGDFGADGCPDPAGVAKDFGGAVTSVRTARQVIDALNAQGSEIDLLLLEIDLPIAKGLKMLKYITRNKELRHIPVVMMSAKDEVSVVVKCLRLGAADYLVKPLRTNELLNLWTHMWRRRRMLGLAEKDILSHEFDLLVSDPSDGNTNSTLLSDDTDDRSKAWIPETGMSNLQELESKHTAAEVGHKLDVSEVRDKSGRILSCPKKSKLKVGESSAFFTYVKSNAQTKHFSRCGHTEILLQPSSSKENHQMPCTLVDEDDGDEGVSCSGDGDRLVGSDPRDVNFPSEPSQPSAEWRLSKRQSSHVIQPQNSDGQADASGVLTVFHVPCYFTGMMRQNAMHSCPSLYPGGFYDLQAQCSPVVLPQYNSLPQGPQVPIISSFSYYPVNLGLQPEQIPSPHVWPSMPSSSTPDAKSGRIERREAALMKFRQKRKDRCFDKKIRYVNRKRLAERRPRVRGQFVRQLNGVNVDLNGCPTVDDDFGDEEDDDEEESVPTDVGGHSSPEHDASEF